MAEALTNYGEQLQIFRASRFEMAHSFSSKGGHWKNLLSIGETSYRIAVRSVVSQDNEGYYAYKFDWFQVYYLFFKAV